MVRLIVMPPVRELVALELDQCKNVHRKKAGRQSDVQEDSRDSACSNSASSAD